MTLKSRLAHRLFGDIIQQAVTAAISTRVDDSRGWDQLSAGGPHDLTWSELRDNLDDALEAWRKNFMIRRIVNLTTSYVVGDGIQITSGHPWVQPFLDKFWTHPENRIPERLEPLCDELTRAGEIFLVLHTGRADGIPYVRFVPASRIREIDTHPDDYEVELRYGQIQETSTELKWWLSPKHPDAFQRSADFHIPPVMLHLAVNRPIGAIRGEGDLGPILKWALRYSNWLEDRVRLNRVRTRQGMLDIEIADDSLVEQKKYQLRKDDPMRAGIYVHGPGETTTLHDLNIQADNAEPDGKALRLAIAAGANVGLHYLGEGETVNYATAKEMGEPTARFYTNRQNTLVGFLIHVAQVAYRCHSTVMGYDRSPVDLQLEATTTEVARADNQGLATAARDIVQALKEMRLQGWIDDETAIKLAFKFAGEVIGDEEIQKILQSSPPPEGTEGGDQGSNTSALRYLYGNHKTVVYP
jgi:hypothetical protein